MRLVTALLFSVISIAAPSFHLPDDILPRKYTVDLTIDPSKDTFEGVVRIDVEMKKSADHIWLNAKDITTLEASVGKQKARAEAVDDEFLDLALDSPAGPGRATISIRYQGKLDANSVVGPYRKKVGDDWYVFTTFTPIDARRAFPCFDEPRFKAPWEMTIHTLRDLKAFANGRETQITDEPGGMQAVHFATTEPLPSEVVAFAVGPFDVFEGAKAGHGTPIRVLTPRGLGEEGRAAAQATVDVLPRLEAYTGIPYPFGKLDHVALPEGAFGAVENPGLITYREKGLLAAPEEETPQKTRAIRSIESHEIGHQWFGDMVTQAGWEDVWLSEGFATWFSAKVMDEEQPPPRKHLLAVASRERIMAFDDSPRTRPVRAAMNSREDTKNVYARVVYDKGASILLMLDGWLGEDRVRNGLRAYLKDHRFGNATTADLESELRGATGIDPSPVMDAFLNQTGIPVIHGEVRCDGAAPKIEIEQTNAEHHWNVPVCWRADGSQTTCTVLDAPHAQVGLASCPTWIYLNAGGTGYYRTAWTAAQLSALDVSKLTAAERMTLVGDLKALKSSMDVSATLTKLASDTEPEIAKAATDALQ
ncbi:MAG TPA: M1 family aminopeptidase [Bryobacteraceae bacterium]|nr:M1 family aminopeptidase [Bryobacteraceae bacterium]